MPMSARALQSAFPLVGLAVSNALAVGSIQYTPRAHIRMTVDSSTYFVVEHTFNVNAEVTCAPRRNLGDTPSHTHTEPEPLLHVLTLLRRR